MFHLYDASGAGGACPQVVMLTVLMATFVAMVVCYVVLVLI